MFKYAFKQRNDRKMLKNEKTTKYAKTCKISFTFEVPVCYTNRII